NTEAVEGLAHESRRRSAPVFGVDPSPVVAFGLAHGTDIRVAGGPPAVSELSHELVVRRGPLRVRAGVPIRPVHQPPAEGEDHGAGSSHPLETVRKTRRSRSAHYGSDEAGATERRVHTASLHGAAASRPSAR